MEYSAQTDVCLAAFLPKGQLRRWPQLLSEYL
jgi:hypothetical protein